MGSKKHKKDSKKRKHHGRSESPRSPSREDKERRKHKKRHHKEKKKDKHVRKDKTESSNSDDDVIYVPPPPKISKLSSPPTPPRKSLKPSLLSPSKTATKPPSPPPPPTITIEHSPSPPPPPPPSISSVKPSGNAEQSLSIEDTNALRAKLGLKPLAVPPKDRPSESNLIKCPETNVEFLHKPAEDLTQKKMTEKIRLKLAEKKEKREIEAKLRAIKGLGDDNEDDNSAVNWVKKSRKLEEERLKAKLKAKELDEMDEEFGIGDLVAEEIQKEKIVAYTGANLTGLTVEHDVDSFIEGKSVILTLKDKGVLEDESDALVNVNMIDDEKYKKNILNKKMKPYGYDGVDNGEMDVDDEPGVLSKYDEEIEGAKKSSFVLGETNSQRTKMKLKNLLKEDRKVKLESLVTAEMKLASDYYAPEEMKIKRPKKKKKLRSRTLKPDDLMADAPLSEKHNGRSLKTERGIIDNPLVKVESEDPMDLDGVPSMSLVGMGDVKVEEESDTELELALKKARRLKQMPVAGSSKKLLKIEEVLEQVDEDMEEDGGPSAIILNSTAEFCRTLGDIPTYGMAGNRDEEPNLLMDFDKSDESKKKRSEEMEERGGWNEVDIDDKLVETKQIEGTILDAEPDLGAGVAGALRLAVSKGYLEKETTSRPSASRFAHLAAQNYSIDDKAHAMEDDKFGRRERYLGPTMDFKERDSYKPNIKLEYIDDEGHLLSAKEAFRYLSHKFHGKGPGKNKVEKRMKKSEQEVLMKQMSSSDTPLGTLNMLQHKQKETQSAFVVLSGSKGLTTPAAISKTKVTK